MKKSIKPGDIPDAWDAESLYLKALRYAERIHKPDSDDWEKALWSGLCLELLARATLANVSPALLVDNGEKNWQSLLSALGFTPTESKFSPRSLNTIEVFRRLTSIFPNFTQELENFCILHTGKRNAELHSGDAIFDGVALSTWQPRFYLACSVLLETMKVEVKDFFGEVQATAAVKMIEAAADDSAKAVKGDLAAHAKVWEAKSKQDKETLTATANSWAARQWGHRVECPACRSNSLVIGEPIGAPHKKLSGDEIVETQEHLPNQFECIACGLKILGLSKLSAVGLGDRYKKTTTYGAADYYAPQDPYPDFEEDNNEPF